MHDRPFRRLLLGSLATLALMTLFGWWMTGLEPTPVRTYDSVVALNQLPSTSSQSIDEATSADPTSLLQNLYSTKPEVEAAAVATGADQVRVGVFLLNNYDLDMTVPMASSKGRLWLRWKEPFQKKLEAMNATAADLLTFSNQIQAWNGQTKLVADQPIRLRDGDYYQCLRFDANFYVQKPGLHYFPFQTVHIPFMVQLNNDASDFSFEKLRLVPDRIDSGVGRFIELNGFVMRGWNIAEFRNTYDSDFGLATAQDPGKKISLSEIIFDVAYARSVRSSVLTLFQPLAILMATVILSPSLSSRFWDIRIAIPATAILTMVFLQQGYRATLPQLPFLTFIDRMYVICYVLCLACFVLLCVGGQPFARCWDRSGDKCGPTNRSGGLSVSMHLLAQSGCWRSAQLVRGLSAGLASPPHQSLRLEQWLA